MSEEIKQFIKERNEALTTLDESKIRAMHIKWNGHDLPLDSEMFWAAVHKAITGIQSLPIELRRSSKLYLQEHCLHSFDDGDL